MKKSLKLLIATLVALVAGGIVYAAGEHRIPVEFFTGHSHEGGGTQGAPEHSGGTDRNGCHNGSVPYHCH